MTDYDVPWKEVLDSYLQGFLELCLPGVHDGIDWSVPIENHEQELPKLFPNSLSAGRIADKLFRARFKGSEQPTWFMIHTEVQVARQAEFARRMFTCYYRILDRYQEPVVCIGILGDSSKSWRPERLEIDTLGCLLSFEFPVVKLQDFATRIEDLEDSSNPFALVIASHLRAQGSTGNPGIRYRFKVELVRRLFEKKWAADQVRRLFRFIDWVMDLPIPLELQFNDELKSIETEMNMPYVTSIERLAREEGKLEGELKGKIQLLHDLLHLPPMADSEFEKLTIEQLNEMYLELRRRFDSR